MENPSNQLKPFKTISLALSGGGYRAATFSLGTLHYLNRIKHKEKPLLDNVKTISTISGGTIAGTAYVVAMKRGKSFEAFYDHLLHILQSEDLIDKAMDQLMDNAAWKGQLKNRNLINAFAKVYDKVLLEGATFDLLFQPKKIHLQDILFNATEFNEGLEFRFFKSYNNRAMVGNSKVTPKITTECFREMKIADALAASSCFPAGFEPIAFPDDFIYDGAIELKKLIDEEKRAVCRKLDLKIKKSKDNDKRKQVLYGKKELAKDSFNPTMGLMDGGIVDNQGIGGILRVEDNRSKKIKNEETNRWEKVSSYHDLIIVTDVASYFIDDFQFVPAKPSLMRHLRGLGTLRGVDWVMLAIFLVMLASLKFCSWNGIDVFATIFMTVIGTYALFRIWMIRKYKKSVPLFFQAYINRLSKLKFKIWGHFVKERVSSMLIMNLQVFLKRIRSQWQTILYEDEWWDDRRVANFVYCFKKMPDGYVDERKIWKNIKRYNSDAYAQLKKIIGIDSQDRLQAQDLIEVATDAANMSTTLWFSDEDKKDQLIKKLVATGQFTTCYNIIKYIVELQHSSIFEHLSSEDKEALQYTLNQATKDWEMFCKAPLHML